MLEDSQAGSLKVAGGAFLSLMCWHLVTWGTLGHWLFSLTSGTTAESAVVECRTFSEILGLVHFCSLALAIVYQ